MSEPKRKIQPIFPFDCPGRKRDNDRVVRRAIDGMKLRIELEQRRAANAADPSWPQEAGWRYNTILNTQQFYETLRNPYPVIFVSFTEPKWRDAALAIGAKSGATIVTDSLIGGAFTQGFRTEFERRQKDALKSANKDIPSIILYRMTHSDAFLGIWTGRFTGRDKGGVDRYKRRRPQVRGNFPSPWMPFEYGVAFAHQNRHIASLAQQNLLRILWDKEIHSGYTDRLFLSNQMDDFDPDGSYQKARRQVAKAIDELCEEVHRQNARE